MRAVEMMNLMERVIAYETERHDLDWIVQFFADLIATGLAWQLQGHYGREAKAYIENGLISVQGEVDWNVYEEYFAL
jgi:hypothetical protein